MMRLIISKKFLSHHVKKLLFSMFLSMLICAMTSTTGSTSTTITNAFVVSNHYGHTMKSSIMDAGAGPAGLRVDSDSTSTRTKINHGGCTNLFSSLRDKQEEGSISNTSPTSSSSGSSSSSSSSSSSGHDLADFYIPYPDDFYPPSASSTSSSSSSSSSVSPSWGIGDDWSELTSENPNNIPSLEDWSDSLTLDYLQTLDSNNDIPNNDIPNNDIPNNDHDSHSNIDKRKDNQTLLKTKDETEDELVQSLVDLIHCPIVDPNGPALYDTQLHSQQHTQQPIYSSTRTSTSRATTTTSTTTTSSHHQSQSNQEWEENMAKEIGLLVRCNEVPDMLLVQEGRALPELTQQELYCPTQLVTLLGHTMSAAVNVGKEEAKRNEYKPTVFFKDAISLMFHLYAKQGTSAINTSSSTITATTATTTHSSTSLVASAPNKPFLYMDKEGIAAWMTKSLQTTTTTTSTTSTSNTSNTSSRTTNNNNINRVGKHDKRVNAILSRYATHGSGFLTKPQFMNLYMDAVMYGIVQDEDEYDDNMNRGVKMMERMKMSQPKIQDVWRDLENHGFEPPILQKRRILQQEIDAQNGQTSTTTSTINSSSRSSRSSSSSSSYNSKTLMDECEILEWSTNQEHSTPRSSSSSSMVGATVDTIKSSHEKVELCRSDGTTPKRIRDGEFVFIDEESCIGCYQCANIAPSSFEILETGRARTHTQAKRPEVQIAISACPVNCMHHVSFDELVEMETARDVGDGRDDHRHFGFGNERLNVHTPLNVARTGSDMNHKSSWYHYLKQKCFTSKDCPKRGCYNCPVYRTPGANPYFQMKHRQAESSRSRDIMESGECDSIRKFVDL